jgi:hypothetical protein
VVLREGSVEWMRNQVVKQLRGAPCGMDASLGNAIVAGVAFHHAGLTLEERMIVEGAFHCGTISILTATSTLAAGVNLPADVVVIRSPKVGASPLDVGRYRQMVGRAGRAGKGLTGESYILSMPQEYTSTMALLHAPIPPLRSCLASSSLSSSSSRRDARGGGGKGPGPAACTGGGAGDVLLVAEAAIGLRRAVLEALDLGLAATFEDLIEFVGCTFLAQNLAAAFAVGADSLQMPSERPPVSREGGVTGAGRDGAQEEEGEGGGNGGGGQVEERASAAERESARAREREASAASHGAVMSSCIKAAVEWLEAHDMIVRVPAPPRPALAPLPPPPANPSPAQALQQTAAAAGGGGEGGSHGVVPRDQGGGGGGGGGRGGEGGGGRGERAGGGGREQEGGSTDLYWSTQLGKAVVASSLGPCEALVVYQDLLTARQVGVVMEDDLHVIFLATPLTPFALPWARFYDIYQALPPHLTRIAAKIGIDERFLLRARTHTPITSSDYTVSELTGGGGGGGTGGGGSTGLLPEGPGGVAEFGGGERGVREERGGGSAGGKGSVREGGVSMRDSKDAAGVRVTQIHARFFSALLLRELLLETHIGAILKSHYMLTL